MATLLINNAIIINENTQIKGSVLIEGSFIKSILPLGEYPKINVDNIINANWSYLLPGVIDDQVHFREPGLTYKGDIGSESHAAVAGGVTSYMEMPNTIPQTTNQQLLEEKYNRASEISAANFSFYIGATNNNIEELLKTDPSKNCGIKVFMGSSTGNMLVDDPDILTSIFAQSKLLIAIHSEDESIIRENTVSARLRFGEDVPVYFHPVIRNDEACFISTRKAVELASKYSTRLHILHLSTEKELELLNTGPLTGKNITAEVCVHHLMFDNRDYFTKGNLIKWNPSIKSERDKNSLIQALINNKIDVIATDHAPHTLEEKQNTYFKAPSGGPLVQHSLVAMLEFCKNGILKPETVVAKMCHNPAEIFHIKKRGYIREGYFADLVIVNPNNPWTVSNNNILYKCGWSPFTGMTFSSKVTHTIVNGNVVYENGMFYDKYKGIRLEFDR